MPKKHTWKQENIDAIDVAIAILDKSGTILLLNRECKKIFNEKHDFVVGKNWFELLLDGEKSQYNLGLFHSAMSNDLQALELLQNIETVDISRALLINWKLSVLMDKESNIEGAIYLGTDITKQKEIESSLQLESEEQNALNSILRITLEDISLEQQLQKALDIMLSLSWLNIVSKGGIFLVDEKSDTLLLKVHNNLEHELLSSCARVPFGHCLCGRAAASREIQYACCLDERHEIRFDGIEPHGHYNVPILSSTDILGVIVLYLEHGHKRDEREEKFLGSVGHTLAGLIEHRLTQEKLYASREKLSQTQEIAHLGGLEWNIEDDEIKLSSEAKLISTAFESSEKITLKNFLDIVAPDDRALLKEALELAVTEGTSFSLDYHIEGLDGTRRVIHSYAKPVADKEGKIVRLSGTLQDITEYKQMQEKLSQSIAVFENTTEAVVITDASGKIISTNRAFSTITGYSEEDVVGKNPSILKSGKHDNNFYKEMWNAISIIGSWQGEIWNRRKNGDIYPEWLNISTVKDKYGNVSNYVGVFSDISSLKESQQKLDYLAHHDQLTGLPNRLLLTARMEHSLAQARRNGTLLAVLFLDLDHFKKINDTLGHYVGDFLIKEVSNRLLGCVREEDTISRFSGDEFNILIEEMNDANFAGTVASKIITTLSEKYVIQGHEIFMTCSIGISIFPDDGKNIATLFKNADSALYRAKEQGRNSYQYYTKELSIRAMERMVMENNLRHALERNELVLYYQPQVDMYSGDIVGMEALLRWKHPEIGLIPPDSFIPLAEETGLIIPIGEWVLKTACLCLQSWIKSGLPKIRVAVNVSSRQFKEQNFPEIVSNVLRQTGLEADLLEIELTERIVMENAEASVKMISDLKKLNVQFSIDDFGTGYSSLSYLKRFPLNRIKIDKSFVDNVTSSTEDAAIVQAIISMSHGLNLKTIAEGVETLEQLEFLRLKECDEIQGYYFSRPLPEEEMKSLLSKGTKIYTQNRVSQKNKCLLIVGNKKSSVDAIENALEVDEYEIVSAFSSDEAIDILAIKSVDVILCEHFLPQINGIEMLTKAYGLYPDVVRILLVDYDDSNVVAKAVNESSVYRVIPTSWLVKDLRKEVKAAFLYKRSTVKVK